MRHHLRDGHTPLASRGKLRNIVRDFIEQLDLTLVNFHEQHRGSDRLGGGKQTEYVICLRHPALMRFCVTKRSYGSDLTVSGEQEGPAKQPALLDFPFHS